jgi:hypothetical protein
MLNAIIALSALLVAGIASAESVPITGNVSSKCSIYTSVAGVYGNPTPDALSTDPVDGGVDPVVRFDVTAADYYIAKISWPNSFTTSPTLDDALAWDGEVTVSQTSDTGMAGYEAAKVEYENVTEYDLTVAGSTWFQIESSVDYGYGKSFPGGEYAANVVAECIAS